ncbi:hypothetical protein QJS66_11380 [Kocuria rhizophila]|nr:hypothetical protein QJS66_11380 [Kocuria rhizophila]
MGRAGARSGLRTDAALPQAPGADDEAAAAGGVPNRGSDRRGGPARPSGRRAHVPHSGTSRALATTPPPHPRPAARALPAEPFAVRTLVDEHGDGWWACGAPWRTC